MAESNRDADVAFIQALAELLRENDLTELQVKREYGDSDTLNVRVSRALPPAPTMPHHTMNAPMQSAPAHAPQADRPAADVPSDPAQHPGAVTSPMVGTVYLSPEPGAAAFVKVGAEVSEGDTLLIVEAMKTMNHIPAPHSGTVTRVLVDDGAPVEYGAPLVILE